MKKILCTFFCMLLFFSCESVDSEAIEELPIQVTAETIDSELTKIEDLLEELPESVEIEDLPEELSEPFQIPLDMQGTVAQACELDVLDDQEVSILTDEIAQTEIIPDTPTVLDVIDNVAAVEDSLETSQMPESTEIEVLPEIEVSVESEVLPEELPESLQLPLDTQDTVEPTGESEVLDDQEVSILTDEIAQTEIIPDTPTVLDVIDDAAAVEDPLETPQVTETPTESEVLTEEFEPLQLPLDTQDTVEPTGESEVLDDQEVSILTDEIAQTEIIPDTPTVLDVIDDAVAVEDPLETPQVTETPPESEVLTEELPQVAASPEIIAAPEVLQLPLEPVTELISELEVSLSPVEPIFESAPIVPKQRIEINEGQPFDILFPGQGWIYLGEVSVTDPSVVNFLRRQIEGKDTLFVLHAKNIGSTILHFYKQDVLENAYLDEYIEVVVVGEHEQIIDQTSVLAGGLEDVGTSSDPEVSLVEVIDNDFVDENTTVDVLEVSMDQLFEQAQLAYNEQRYTDSLNALDTYFEQSVDQLDRAWFLSGQIYEENSDVRNIRKALYAYETLVTFFPSSSLWDEAQERIIYIKRFYFNIR